MGEVVSLPGLSLPPRQERAILTEPTTESPVFTDLFEDTYDSQPVIDAPSFRHSFGLMRERLRVAKAQTKALGHLAMLDIDKAQLALGEVQAEEPAQAATFYQPPSLKERIRLEASHIRNEQKQKRRHSRNKTLKFLGSASAAVALGLAVPKLLNK